MSDERKVRARHGGHYDGRHRRPGEVFALAAEADFAASWMEPVGWTPPAPAAKPKPAAEKASSTADELARAQARIAELETELATEKARNKAAEPPPTGDEPPKGGSRKG